MGDPQALLQKADKLVSSAGGGFSFFGGKQTKYEDAAQAYIDAGKDTQLASDTTRLLTVIFTQPTASARIAT